MQTVKVKRADLLEILTKNRQSHRGEFETAQAVYRQRMIELLDQRLADAKAGRAIKRYIELPEPEEHTEDYDRVIKMLEMSVDDIIEITQDQFSVYVMNNWRWSDSFASNTRSYASGR